MNLRNYKNIFKTLLEYFLVILVFLLSGYLLLFTDTNSTNRSYLSIIFIFVETIYAIIFFRKKISISFLKEQSGPICFLLVLGIGTICSMLSNKDFSHINSYAIMSCVIFSAFFFSQILDAKNFVRKFTNVLFVLCVISLYFYLFYFASGKINISLLKTYTSTMSNSTYINNLYLNFILLAKPRLQGPFWEPGLFGTFIIFCLFINKINGEKLSVIKYIIFTVCVVLTQSVFIMCVYVLFILVGLLEKRNIVLKSICYFSIFAVFILILINYDNFFGFLAKKMPSLFGKFLIYDGVSNSVFTRILSPVINFKLFLKKPIFGYGIIPGNTVYFEAINGTLVDSQTSTFGQMALWYGIFGFSYLVVIIVGIMSIKKVAIIERIIYLIIFLLLISEEPHNWISFTWILVFYLSKNIMTNRKIISLKI